MVKKTEYDYDFLFLVPLCVSLLVFGSAWIYITFFLQQRRQRRRPTTTKKSTKEDKDEEDNSNPSSSSSSNVSSLTFAKAYKVHTLHHAVALTIATLSLSSTTTNNYEIWGIFWSVGYFIVDILDCVFIEQHLTYTIHGVVCLLLGLANYNYKPWLLFQQKTNSRAAFIETSSIVLYKVKQSNPRNPTLFLVFALVYTCCRILWIPYGIMRPLLNGGNNGSNNDDDDESQKSQSQKQTTERMEPTDIIFILLCGFYVLQLWWWIKILQIIVNEVVRSKVRKSNDQRNDQRRQKQEDPNQGRGSGSGGGKKSQ